MSNNRITEFNFSDEEVICGKYEVLEKLGAGTEGEVYKVVELNTGIVLAAKVFYPHKNKKNRVSNMYAKKLHKLASCPIVINYHGQESFWYQDHEVICLLSEFVEGDVLSTYLTKQPGKRMGVIHGLQLLHAIAVGLDSMHRLGEYHGDIHTDNIILRRYGLGFELKLLDMYDWKDSKSANRAEDISKLVRLFYDCIGGSKFYTKLPIEVKEICLGLRRDLILKKFRSASQLRDYIENIHWETPGY